MTPHARYIQDRRAKRSAEVQKRLDEQSKYDTEQSKRDAQAQERRRPSPEEMAHIVLTALQSSESEARDIATRYLKNAPDGFRARVYELAGMNNPFKQRRSRQTNGY